MLFARPPTFLLSFFKSLQWDFIIGTAGLRFQLFFAIVLHSRLNYEPRLLWVLSQNHLSDLRTSQFVVRVPLSLLSLCEGFFPGDFFQLCGTTFGVKVDFPMVLTRWLRLYRTKFPIKAESSATLRLRVPIIW